MELIFDMNAWLTILNAGAVGLFGIVLSAAFCEIQWNRRHQVILGASMVLMGLVQVLLYVTQTPGFVRKAYPLITHLPLVIVLAVISGKKLWSLISVLAAYLCCQLRRWIALLFVDLLAGDSVMQETLELIITLPLLALLLYFVAPYLRYFSRFPLPVQLLFGLIPAVGYAFDYTTRVYTNWLVAGVPAAVEFMPFICALAYLLFTLYTTRMFHRQGELEQTKNTLELQAKQSAEQIAELKKAQELTAAYRHDLRHHLQYISDCIQNDAPEQAQEYIHRLNQDISSQSVVQYCENTTVNLILTSYISRAQRAGIATNIQVALSEMPHISDTDLCILLSNALENALHACVELRDAGREASIEVRGYEKNSRLFLSIINSCGDTVCIENGLPITAQKGHGIGVRSICAVVEKYRGLYTFDAADGKFTLRISL